VKKVIGKLLLSLKKPPKIFKIHQKRLDKDAVHEIKHGMPSGPSDWTGMAPNGDVITGDSEENAENHGSADSYT